MTRVEVLALLAEVREVRAAVLGHFCLDAYWFLDPSRGEVSVETGLKVRSVREQRYSPGGAGNIAANLAELGAAKIHALGVVGADPWAGEIRRQLDRLDVDIAGLVTQEEGWATQVFIKPHAAGKEEPRFDTADFNVLSAASRRALLDRMERLLPAVDVAIVNQQSGEGIHSAETRRDLSALMARHPDARFIADTRDYGDSYLGAILKLNEREAMRVTGTSGAAAAADALHARTGKPVFVTRGPLGLLVRDADGLAEVPGIEVSGETDPVGAGDSMLAGIALALGAGRDARTAAELGNLAAAVTVRKLKQTGTASPDEILAIFPWNLEFRASS